MNKLTKNLKDNHSGFYPEAGCDEAGRGCLAGPVFAAAVILPENFFHEDLNDSKQLNALQRNHIRTVIEKEALAFAVAQMSSEEIDTYNILWASIRSMHKALDLLSVKPAHIIVDGNKFMPYNQIPFDCIVKGDSKYKSIAAASILAKTYRDAFMENISLEFPMYHWQKNKGYPTKAHRNAIAIHGATIHHRKSFRLLPEDNQLAIFK